jgi:hypothetical protein
LTGFAEVGRLILWSTGRLGGREVGGWKSELNFSIIGVIWGWAFSGSMVFSGVRS